MMVSILSTEIIALILQELDGEDVHLRSCSLTCRDWAHLCRPLLFRRIVLLGHLRYARAYQLFIIQSPHLRHYVRELELQDVTPSRAERDGDPENSWLSDRYIVDFIQSFPLIDELFIEHVDIFVPPYLHALELQAKHLTVTRLHLGYCTYSHSSQLLYLLDLFSQTLQSLSLVHIVPHEPPKQALMGLAESRSVQLPVLCRLSIFLCELQLESHELQMPSLLAFKTIFSGLSLLHCIPAQIGQMTITIEPTIAVSPSTQRRTTVQSLHLILDLPRPPFTEIEGNIRKLAVPTSLQRLYIHIYDQYHDRSEIDPAISSLDDFLSYLHNTAALRSVTFFDDSLTDQRAEEYRQKLPKLHKVRILHVDNSDAMDQVLLK